MSRLRALRWLLPLFLSAAQPARAALPCEALDPWRRVSASLGHAVEARPLVLLASAAVPPLVFAPTGLDQRARVLGQRDLGGRHDLEPVSLVAPYALGGTVLIGYGLSAAFGECALRRPFAAVLQAMAGGLLFTATAKWAVGREWPNQRRDPSAPDRLSHPERARHFAPFNGALGAWPSGHTLSMFAAAAAFRASESALGWQAWLGYPLALGVGTGMWLNDRHWASDVLSGMLLGEAIGSSVGSSFAVDASSGASGDQVSAPHGALLFTALPNGAWLAWSGRF